MNYLHQAIYCNSDTTKQILIEQLKQHEYPKQLLFLKNRKGLFFTNQTLSHYLQEEAKHDLYTITALNGKNLLTSSDGEQKKALFYHLLQQKPDYLVIDDVFGNLDKASQQEIKKLLQHTKYTIIIQLLLRQQDLLPFIAQLSTFENNCLQPINVNTTIINQTYSIPQPLISTINISNPLVHFSNVTVHYEDRCVLKNIHWKIDTGEFWQLQGPNGSGKTTLLSMITGDNTKAYGQNITLFGYKKGSGESIWDIKQHIGYFSQHLIRFFNRRDSAINIIAGGLLDSVGLYQIPSDLMLEVSLKWLTILGLSTQKDKSFTEFSLGQQRLLFLARAMIKHPPLLILDEPTIGLTDNEANLLVQLVNQIASQTTTAIVFVSHRAEALLHPQYIFELMPEKDGSHGKVHIP